MDTTRIGECFASDLRPLPKLNKQNEMKIVLKTLLLIITSLTALAQKQISFESKEVYKSVDLVITQIAENSFQHTSYLPTQDFGNVPCNGLIVRNSNEVIIFDTPTNDKSSEELIRWITVNLHHNINAIIATHFHNDCLGGLKAFHEHHIPSYAYFKTIALAKENNFEIPKNSFTDQLILKVGKETTITQFFGEGHTKDNVVGYFPSEYIMFGGCLIKELNATKGFLGDASVTDWSNTVEKVKKQYPNVKIVVPGHGVCGNISLLDYTIQLFKAK